MINIQGLTIKLKKTNKILLNNVSFAIKTGEIFALVGSSGSGKTIISLSILQLLSDNLVASGEINYNNKNLLKTNINNIRGKEISFIFQNSDSAINPVFTIGNQLKEILTVHTNFNRAKIKQKIIDMLELVGLDMDTTNKYAHELSGGQKQRVMIAMALLSGAKFLIADEPTTALDVSTQKQILELLLKLKVVKKLTILIITHDLMLVKMMADTVGLIKDGNLLEIANKEDFFTKPTSEYAQILLKKLIRNRDNNKTMQTVMSIIDINKSFPIKSGLFRRIKSYQNVLNNINLTLSNNTNLAIVGESGSGKTTLANIIMRQLNSDNGQILFENKNINKIAKEHYAGLVQIVFQNVFASFSPRKILLDTILDAMFALNINHQDNSAYICSLFSEVGLDCKLMRALPHQLSGGELQRVAIVRALCVNPKVIICDEPTSALDNILKKQILDLLFKIQKKHMVSYIFITHDMAVVRYFADNVCVLQTGNIVEYGNIADVLDKPQSKYTKMLLNSVL